MTLKQKANQNQGCHCYNSWPVDLAGFDALSVGSALPESSNVSGGSTGISVYQISRPHSAGQVGAFRQVRTLILGSENAGMATGRRSSPSAVFLGSGVDSQREAGVDSLDGTEVYGVFSEDVADANQVVLDANFWKPEHNQCQVTKKQHDWKRANGSLNTQSNAAHKPGQRQNADANGGQDSGKPRVKNFHVNTLASIEEACVGI